MANGSITMTNHGSYAISGSALKTAVDAINAETNKFASGAALYFIPLAGGQQVQLISTAIA